MCSPTFQATKPDEISMMSVLREHVIKGAMYAILTTHAVSSVIQSTTTFSYVVNILIAIFGLWLVAGEIHFAVLRFQKKMLPGTLGFPIVRDINFIVNAVTGRIARDLKQRRDAFGTMFTSSFIGMNRIVIVGGEADLTWLFNQDRKAVTEVSWPPHIQMLLGPGAVANQTGKYHRVLRRLLEPYFAPTFVQNYTKIMDETTQEELEKWSSFGEFQSSEIFKLYALRLFYASSFGRVDETTLMQLHDDFKIWIGGFLSLTARRIPGTNLDNAMKARDRILEIVDGLIEDFEAENPEGSVRAETTIMGRLIYGKGKDGTERALSRDEMKDNILNLIFAGHDTTYMSISTILYHLSRNPDARKALTEEIMSLKVADSLDTDDLKNAPVLNAVISEALRMDPPVSGGFRKSQKEIEHKGYKFQKGSVFNYSIMMAATDENTYTRNDKFAMERFLPENHLMYNPKIASDVDPRQGKAAYPIFGGGTHVCLGKAFALLELRVLVVRLLRHYTVDVRKTQKVEFPVNGWTIDFKLTKRKDE